MKNSIESRDVEITFGDNEIIVSKTNLKGHITYANDIFCRVAEMSTADVIGKPHSIIRHPDMPRAVFKLLWDTLSAGKEIFAYVKNMSATGKYYWVLAHVTPSFDRNGNIDGYHSNRRSPDPHKVAFISKIYDALLAEEKRHSNAKNGLQASTDLLLKTLEDMGKSYSEFVWSVGE